MADLGLFHAETIKKLNRLLQKYPLAPGYGNDDECTYYTGFYNKKDGVVEDWVDLNTGVEQERWGQEFFTKWNQTKDLVLFSGEVFALETPKRFLVAGGRFVNTTDRVVRSFSPETSVSVLSVLGQAYHILYDPQNLATSTQGTIGKVHVKENAEIPTLIFDWCTH